MQAADPFAAIGRPPAAVAAPATPAPARAAVGGIDDFGGFFAGSAAPASQPAAKPAAVAPPPQAAAPARPAADDFDVFARGGGEAAPPPPQQPQPSAAPVAPVLSPPPSPAAPDFDFFSGGAPAAAPATPAVQQPAFDDLDALGSIGGGNVKKAQSSDPLDNIMGWGAAPAQTHAQPVVAPRAHGAQPDLFGSHVSAAQVAVRPSPLSPGSTLRAKSESKQFSLARASPVRHPSDPPPAPRPFPPHLRLCSRPPPATSSTRTTRRRSTPTSPRSARRSA